MFSSISPTLRMLALGNDATQNDPKLVNTGLNNTTLLPALIVVLSTGVLLIVTLKRRSKQ